MWAQKKLNIIIKQIERKKGNIHYFKVKLQNINVEYVWFHSQIRVKHDNKVWKINYKKSSLDEMRWDGMGDEANVLGK